MGKGGVPRIPNRRHIGFLEIAGDCRGVNGKCISLESGCAPTHTHRVKIVIFLLPILLIRCVTLVNANSVPRHLATVQESYTGTHPDLYAEQHDRVRILVRQAQLEISSQLGLFQYQEGFRWPLTIRFDDQPMAGVEHALAYVQLLSSGQTFAQELVVNLDVMSGNHDDFDKIFYHEMTHAVLNDAVIAEFRRPLPSWVQEGLAVYISGDGEDRVKALAQRVRKFQAQALVHDLEDPVLDYAGDYLAFRYLKDKHSINSLQAFVRLLTDGKSPPEAIEESTGLSWEKFKTSLKDYSAQTYRQFARPDY